MTSSPQALAQLQHAAGTTGDCHFTASTPTLASRFCAVEAASAALGAGALVAAEIIAQRGCPRPAVQIDTRQAEASLLSFALQRFEDASKSPAARLPPEERTAAAGFYQTADERTVYLHSGFQHNTQGLLQLLGTPDDRDAVAAAIKARTAQALEDAIAERGLCGAMLRSAPEWDQSAAGKHLAAQRIVEVHKLTDSPPRPWSGARHALAGCNVLDATRVLAGPTCARTLALYGANVLRIGAEDLPSIPLFVADTGIGKRNAFVDLKTPDGRSAMDRLLAEADVFSQGYRSGALERLGYGEQALAQRFPGLIYVSINCYGHAGDWRSRPGWEQLAQVVTGMAHQHGIDVHGQPGKPELQPAAVTDYTTGYLAAYGALVALARRAVEGGSYAVRVSLARTGMWVSGLGHRDAMPNTGLNVAALTFDRVDTQWGGLAHLAAPVLFDGKRLAWTRPPAPLGAHPPSFR
ncbi:MAG: hypothetical protein HC809_01550 [Gammaproteobacteria bacterium]|nr:hypothetical protein [Gammaproteobacteria bacterium]